MTEKAALKTNNKHPKGLPYLFFTEMWERFGYFLLLGIFFLYMKAPKTDGGMGFDPGRASDIFGTLIALTYLTPFIGGFIADRKIGYIKAVYIGGALMGLGYMCFAINGMTAFYAAMALIVIGNGFFKSSMSALLGNLYATEPFKSKKDAGFNIFYMGINFGAFICNIIAAFMRNKYGWDEAFIAAGVGMFLGLGIFTIGLKHYRAANVLKPAQKGEIGMGNLFSVGFLPAVVTGVLGWMIPDNIFGSDATDAFIFASFPIIFFFISIYKKAEKNDKRPIAVLLAIFAMSIMFWTVFKQTGTALITWTESYTDRQVSGMAGDIAESLYLVDKVTYGKDSIPAFDNNYKLIREKGNIVKTYDYPMYFKNMDTAKLPEEGTTIRVANPELFQSINPFWIIVLTPLVVAFFAYLRKKGKEPTTPSKIVWGMLISALSCLIMMAAVHYSDNGTIKVSAWWIFFYGLITVGEIFLSPMGLSLVSKLSPPRITALMMGGFFLATAIGNKLSGALAKSWYNYENKQLYFVVNFILLLVAAGIGFALLKWMNKVMKEKSLQ